MENCLTKRDLLEKDDFPQCNLFRWSYIPVNNHATLARKQRGHIILQPNQSVFGTYIYSWFQNYSSVYKIEGFERIWKLYFSVACGIQCQLWSKPAATITTLTAWQSTSSFAWQLSRLPTQSPADNLYLNDGVKHEQNPREGELESNLVSVVSGM